MPIIGQTGGGTTFDVAPYLPKRGRMWHDTSLVLAGNAIAVGVDTNQEYNMYARQNTSANGDTFTNSLVLVAGSYTFSVLGITSPDCPKVDWYKKDQADSGYTIFITGQDWYANPGVYNTRKTGSLTIGANGYVSFKGVVNGKNASSSNYILRLSCFDVIPSAD